MEAEILKQILAKLNSLEQGQIEIKADINSLEQGQSKIQADLNSLEQGQNEIKADVSKLKDKTTKLEVILETETNRNIGLLVDGHKLLNEKLDALKDLNEQVVELKTDTSLLKTITKDLALKVVK